MDEDKSRITNVWNQFYTNFQTSNSLSQNRNNDKVLVQNAGSSLLLETGGSEGIDLFQECGLPGMEITKLNYVLWKLEEMCLPKIIVRFELFKKSVEDSNFSQDGNGYVIIVNNPHTAIKPEKDLDPSAVEARKNQNPGETKLIASNENLIQNSSLGDESSNKYLSSHIESTRDVSADKGFDNYSSASKSTRRSKRSIKQTPKFQEFEKSKSKTIKSESGLALPEHKTKITSKDSSELQINENSNAKGQFSPKPTLVCSLCKDSSFLSQTELLTHWNKHEKVERDENPFLCIICFSSFSKYPLLRLHHMSHIDDVQVKASNKSSHGTQDIDAPQRCVNKKSKITKCCPICNLVLDNSLSLKDHVLTHAPEGEAHACDICQARFATPALIQAHLFSHLGIKSQKHRCPLCGKCFKMEDSLDVHIMTKHKSASADTQQSFQCSKCPKKFRTQNQLDFHSVRHEKVKPFSCDVCGKGFIREKGLESHRRIHSGEGWVCHVCGKSFVNQRVLEEHSTVHTGEKPHTCDICGARFRLRANLRYHQLTHSPSKAIKCSYCPKTFIDAHSHARHTMMHTGEKPWKCQVCGKGFVQELTLSKHMNLHNGENRHQCHVCLRSFVDKWGLLKHSTIHTGERPYECRVCGRTFRIKKGLEDHEKLHDVNQQLPCPLCPKRFVERRHLEHHLRVHRGERPFVCEICGDRFVNTASLKVHHRRHTGEKPYKCSFCPKTFTQYGSHVAHERFHRGERPYPCDLCPSAFITRSQLTIHQRKHYNVRPYQCEECDYAATTASLLKVHKLKHSSEKPFRCPVCPSAFKRQNHLDVHVRKHCGVRRGENDIVSSHADVVVHHQIHESGDRGSQTAALDDTMEGTVTVVELYQCSLCEASFPSQPDLEQHMKGHEIIVVTAAPGQDGVLEIPAIEGAHGASSEVAYDIVLL